MSALPSTNDLIFCKPSAEVQFTLVALQSAFWYIVLAWVAPPLIIRVINGLPDKNGFLDKNRASFKKAFFWEIGDDRRIQTEQVALVSGILIQHAVGGALCLPSVL